MPDAALAAAGARQAAGDSRGALAMFGRALAAAPAHVPALMGAALLHKAAGEPTLAAALYRRAAAAVRAAPAPRAVQYGVRDVACPISTG